MDDIKDDKHDDDNEERNDSEQKPTRDPVNAENSPEGKTALTSTIVDLSQVELETLK